MTTSEIMEEAAYHNVVERLRDPSHASTLPLSELVQIIRLAGLEIDRVDTIDYEQDVEDWIARAELVRSSLKHSLGSTPELRPSRPLTVAEHNAQ